MLPSLRLYNVAQTRRFITQRLRVLLRETAQPVAVITSALTPAYGAIVDPSGNFHGATLSSFTSIAFHPVPLVAFSLKTPSRTADALRIRDPSHFGPRMVVNLLSSAQAEAAVVFSRPDIHPHPFSSSAVPYTRNADGIPVLSGSLGALSCQIVKTLPLDELVDSERTKDAEGPFSELFIAQVLGCEESETFGGSPLVYYQKAYTTITRTT